MTTKNIFTKLAFLLVCSLVLVACDSDDPDDDGPGEEELITRVTVTFTDPNGISENYSARDADGDGADFELETITLQTNTIYSARIEVADDINNEDITEEVEDEAEEHQFWYLPSANLSDRITVNYVDQDANGLPLGIEFSVVVSDGEAATGTLQVVLSHYDEGPKDGTTLSDESDVDVSFPVEITQ